MATNLLTGNMQLVKEICDALGLKHCKQISIHFGVNEIATVTAEFYPEICEVMQFPAIFKRYKLVELNSSPKIEETTVIGDEIRSYRFEDE